MTTQSTADRLQAEADELSLADDLRRAARDDEVDATLTDDEPTMTASTFDADHVAALGEMRDPPKGRRAHIAGRDGRPGYEYGYAGLADVEAVTRPTYARHGLAAIDVVHADVAAGTLTVTHRVVHVSGESRDLGAMTARLPDNAQAVGSLITYMRRYLLTAAAGIAGADDDDDAQAADAVRPTTSAPRVRAIAASQAKKIAALMDDAGIDREDSTRRQIVAGVIGREVKSRRDLTADEASRTIDAMQAVVDGRARIEVASDDTWRVIALEPDEDG